MTRRDRREWLLCGCAVSARHGKEHGGAGGGMASWWLGDGPVAAGEGAGISACQTWGVQRKLEASVNHQPPALFRHLTDVRIG